MNAERLLALYEQVAEAPGAVPRLRRFVLDLAVRGKLVARDASDELGSDLMERIAHEIEAPSELPPPWKWVPLGRVLDFKYGKGLKANERLDEGPIPVFGSNGIVGYTTTALTEEPAIIVGRKGSAGALNLCDGPSWTTDVAYYVEAPRSFNLRYLFLTLQTSDLDMLGKGVKPGLSRADVYPLPLSIPPLAEQRQIVAKVEELMALLDRLEAARTAREATRDRLTAASLVRLTAPDTSVEDFPTHARFTLATLPALTARSNQIIALRQTILNLAVRGKLVDQDQTDESASALLKRIGMDIADYIRITGVRGAKAAMVSESDQPFALPSGWIWTRLAALCRVVTDGDHQPPPRAEAGVAFLTIGNVTTGTLDFAGCRRVPREYFATLPSYRTPMQGDLLYTVVGATFGRPVLVDSDEPFCVQRHIAILKPSAEAFVPYLHRVLASPFVYKQAAAATTGTAQPTVALKPLRNFLIPLPPLAEQHRIVAKIDALVALCGRLEAALRAADTTRSRLLQSLLHEALTPAATSVAEAAE